MIYCNHATCVNKRTLLSFRDVVGEDTDLVIDVSHVHLVDDLVAKVALEDPPQDVEGDVGSGVAHVGRIIHCGPADIPLDLLSRDRNELILHNKPSHEEDMRNNEEEALDLRRKEKGKRKKEKEKEKTFDCVKVLWSFSPVTYEPAALGASQCGLGLEVIIEGSV